MKKYSWLLFTLIFMLTAVGANAQPDRPDRPEKAQHKTGPMVHRTQIMEKLHLTDTQKQEMRKQRSDMQKQAVQLQAKLRTAQIELRDLITADNPDKSAIEQKLGDIEKIKTDQKLLRVDHWFEAKKILTPDQQKIWKAEIGKLFSEYRGNMQMRHRRFRDFGFNSPESK